MFSRVEGSDSGLHLSSGPGFCVPETDPSFETASWVLDLSSDYVSKVSGFG